MNTFVRREILDNSISGNKIFGGEINWVEGLYTDHLAVPHDAGAGGTGSIDGGSFTIGITDRIGMVDSTVVLGGSIALWSGDYGFYTAMLQNSATTNGLLYLNNVGGPAVKLTANSSDYSYHLSKLIIGATAEQASHYKFEVPNDPSYFSVIDSLLGNFTSLYANNFYFVDHSAFWANIQDVSQLVDYLATQVLAGGVGPLLADPLQEIVDNISAWQMSQIANIQDTITTAKWYAVSELDQLVSVGSNVTFADINALNVIASGDVSGANIIGDKFAETGGNVVFVNSLSGEMKGLRLGWHQPLVPATTDIRIVVDQGICTDTQKEVRITLGSKKTKLINANFVVGDGGGMPTTIAPVKPDTLYYVILIWDPVGSKVAVGFDTFYNGANVMFDAFTLYGWSSLSVPYRILGEVYTNASSKIDMFQGVGGEGLQRSGFKLFGSGVATALEVYAGADVHMNGFANIWIQDGYKDSTASYFKYTFAAGRRPSSIDGLNAPSSSSCNFYNGNSGDKVSMGEIVLNDVADEFICKVYDFGTSEIKENGFDTGGRKGLRDLTSFTLYLSRDT